MRRNTPDDFWNRVDKTGGPTACWPYTGRLKPPGAGMEVGHGCYDHDRTWDYAHRYAWFLITGSMPAGHLCHACDYPPCCNPAHLYAGTALTNAQDRERRGRRNVQGERHPCAKLNEATVRMIRASSTSNKDLAESLGLHRSTIQKVRSRKLWPHL